MPRKYELRSRAERLQNTRQRIVEAIAKLHSQVGPARTTISAIAEEANVERLTVYRHFPTDASMYQACGAHWRELHPRPNAEAWQTVSNPVERLSFALAQIYRFYEDTEGMTGNILRDEQLLPELANVANFGGWLAMVADRLSEAWPVGQRDSIRPAVRLAIDFNTWQLLVRQMALTSEDAARLMLQMVRCATNPHSS